MTLLPGSTPVVDYDGERARSLRIEANTALANGLVLRAMRLFRRADDLDKEAGR